MSTILYGKPVQQKIQADILDKVATLGRKPRMVTIGCADNAEWCSYVNSLAKSADSYSCVVDNVFVDNNYQQMSDLVLSCNDDNTVDGIMIQQPLPRQYSNIANMICSSKDIDGGNKQNMLALLCATQLVAPATPTAVMAILQHYNIAVQGRKIAVIGRGMAVGKPLMLMLINANATVTLCHSKSEDIAGICRSSDIIVSACGVANLVDAGFVNSNSIVVDVGTNFVDGKLCGDVSYDAVSTKCQSITPVPGGVGPVTRACLFDNLVTCAMRSMQC